MSPMAISEDDLLDYVREVSNHRTIDRGQEFDADVVEDGVVVTPRSSGKPRHIARQELREACEEFNRTGSMSRKDYVNTFNGSYILSLITGLQRNRLGN